MLTVRSAGNASCICWPVGLSRLQHRRVVVAALRPGVNSLVVRLQLPPSFGVVKGGRGEGTASCCRLPAWLETVKPFFLLICIISCAHRIKSGGCVMFVLFGRWGEKDAGLPCLYRDVIFPSPSNTLTRPEM